jgi:hypothetical protein
VSAALNSSAQDRLRNWIDTRPFTTAEPFTFGNAGRTLPDVRIDGLTSGTSLFCGVSRFPRANRTGYRAFFRNLLDHADFPHPDRNLTSPDLGRVTATAEPARHIHGASTSVLIPTHGGP